jgi:tripartite-type tricarboxylate transporter receptor subunit TctC
MLITSRAWINRLGLGLASMLLAGAALAQPYPNRPVRMLVPFPPGSGSDVAARAIAQQLTATLGQTFVVENKPGAGGSIAAMEVVRAAPDGYTLMVGSSSSLAANVSLLKIMPYDPAKDLAPVAGVADSVTALIVKPGFPAKTLREFITYVKQNPGKINAGYGSSSTQISLAQLNKLAGLEVVAVPYKGTPLAVNDVLGGTLDVTFADLGSVLAHVKAGTLRGIALTTPRRSALVDWPPIADTLPAYDDITGWIAVVGPAALPREIADKLGNAITQALQHADVKARLTLFGLAPMPKSPEQLKAFIAAEIPKWGRLAREANIQPE